MKFDKTHFYDPKKMMDELLKINLHALISVIIGVESPMHEDLDKKGYLLKEISWGNSRYVDV